MWTIFSFEISRFSTLVLASLVIFGLFWLYFDAWTYRKNRYEIPLLIGLLLLSLSLLAQSMTFETKILMSIWRGDFIETIRTGYLYLRVVAYIFMIIGLYFTPIEKRPELNMVFGLGMIALPLQFSLPILSACVALLYWRRASLGLEQHMNRVAMGFSIFALYELFSLAGLFRTSHDVWVVQLVAPFGIINSIQYALLVISMCILARWTWYYLLKRLSTQLFMITLSGAVGLSLLITGLFVTLLLNSVETESLQKLTGNAKVVSSLLEEKKARLISETKFLSVDPVVLTSISNGERKLLAPIIKNHMIQTGVTSFTVVNSEGKIILQGENEEERGTSLSEDNDVKEALQGEVVSGFVSKSGVVGPEVRIRVIVPAGSGALIASQILDNAYVDGIKTTTGMSISIYGDKVLSSTTEDIGDGITRLVGIRETNQKVLEYVWEKGAITAQSVRLGENEYLSGFVPLKDGSGTTIGAIQLSEPQTTGIKTAGQAVQLTFALVIAIIIALSFPIYLISKRLVAEWE
jgi:hypothetical protein